MRPTTAIPAAAALGLVLATAIAATASHPGADDVLEAPGDALGVSQNDVRDEANHPDDDNGFPHDGSVASPDAPTRILEAYTEARAGNPFLLVHGDEDVSNVLAHGRHGDDHTGEDHHMFPGQVTFEAYWGNWTDTQTTGPAGQTDHQGVVDDRNDCEAAPDDEFTWRGPNPCLPEAQRTDDAMLGFVQPGTHALHPYNVFLACTCPVHAALANHSDRATTQDFAYQARMTQDEQVWRAGNGFSRSEYDASLLITTEVTTAVNPRLLDDSSHPSRYDPHEPAGDGAVHAVDVDVYESAHPTLEAAYRATVWDPGDDHEEPVGPYPDHGPKGFAKDHRHCLHLYSTVHKGPRDCVPVPDAVEENASQAARTAEAATGPADDLVTGPYRHEPNTPADDYNGWATHDPATTYGGLDGTYYEPGPDQTYDGYADAERFWIDTKVGVNTFPVWIPLCCYGYNGYAHVTPTLPSTSSPGEDPTRQDEATQGPGFLYLTTNAGRWHDANGDTWVGDAVQKRRPYVVRPGDPYQGGLVEDPNDYDSPEFAGTCHVDVETTLRPTTDVDGDGQADWGRAGVYVLDYGDYNPYGDAVADVLGEPVNRFLDPVREAPGPVGENASYLLPDDEDGRLSRYRQHGSITVHQRCTGDDAPVGRHHGTTAVLVPGGTLDFGFEAVTDATLQLPSIPGEHPTVRDVDRFEPIADAGAG